MAADSQARVLDVGNCDPDHSMIRRMLNRHFDVELDRVMLVENAVSRMRERQYDLVMVNRLIFENGAEGVELLRLAKSDPAVHQAPIMIISNYSEAHEAAKALGGVQGFGKNSLFDPETLSLLNQYLSPR